MAFFRLNVGSTLQQLRWQRPGNTWKSRLLYSQRCRYDAQLRRRFTDENCDRLFELRALYAEVCILHLGALKLSTRLRTVRQRSGPSVIAVLCELGSILLCLDSLVQQLLLSICTSKT